MFVRLKISKNEIQKMQSWTDNNHISVPLINPDSLRQTIRPYLKQLIRGELEKDVIDGSKLQEYSFPTGEHGDYDVFISYSHNNKNEAVFLASWLINNCNLRVFLDSNVWENADGLLKNIDDLYCMQKDGHYNYHRRNYSTSHVHAMLSMAIMDIINKTECCIFIESEESIYLKSLNNANSAKTLSPWIYEENMMMRLLPSHSYRNISCFSNIRKAEIFDSSENLKITHNIDDSQFYVLRYNSLLSMKGKGVQGLDELYNSILGNVGLD